MQNISETVLPIIRKVRPMLLPYYGNAEIIRQKDGSAHNVVTKLDEEIEKFLATELKKVYPEITFAGEEFGGNRDANKFWLVDPIDGTAHFIRGTPFCTTMLALIEDGKVIFSAIYDFVNDVMFHAEKNMGAFKNAVPIHVSDRPVTNSYISWESKIGKPENISLYLAILKSCMEVKTISAGYEYTLVAEGKIEGRINCEPYGKDYDFAPGCFLVSEAGGVVTNLGSDTYDFKNVSCIATNKPLYEFLTTGPNALFPKKIKS